MNIKFKTFFCFLNTIIHSSEFAIDWAAVITHERDN